MKRKYRVFAGIAALGLAAYIASHLWAQGTSRAAPVQGKIAVVNLLKVMKNYEKFKVYETNLERVVKKFSEREEGLRKGIVEAQGNIQAGKGNKESWEEKLKEGKRKLEDLGMEYKKEMGKLQEEGMVTLYREVEDMVKRVAVANNFSLVLQYGDVIKAEDAYNPRVVQQKVMSGMCLPMYAADGIDISVPVYTYLNKDYKKASASSN